MFSRVASQVNKVVKRSSSSQLNAYCVTSTRADVGQVNDALVKARTVPANVALPLALSIGIVLNSPVGSQKEALEACNFINASADQAYLETDPAARVTKDEYVMRYQQFARDGLEQALQKYDALHSSIGEAEMKRLKKAEAQFALTVADSLLARDKLTYVLKSGKERLREKHVTGLNREDLVFCGD